MRVAAIVVRTLLGLLFIFSSLAYFLNLITPPPVDGPLKLFNEGLAASGYFFTLLKVTELVCGLLLLTGYFVPLALVILAPILINILMLHIFLAPEGLPIALFTTAAGLFLGYYYRDNYAPLFRPSPERP